MNVLPFRALAERERLYSLSKRFQQATSENDFADALIDLESDLPTFADTPFFQVTPPTLKPRAQWKDLLEPFHLGDESADRMLKSAFMPLERELLELRTKHDLFPAFGAKGAYALVDLDYGVVLFPSEGKWVNYPLTKGSIERYQRFFKDMDKAPEMFFSVGALRAHALLPPIPRQNDFYVPFEFTANNRNQLDAYVNGFRAVVKKQEQYELWLRGQDFDYLLDDLSLEVDQGICPWRAVRDSSLVPSLYRNRGLVGRMADLREYGLFCVELGRWAQFLDLDLAIPPFSARQGLDEPEQFPGDGWGGIPEFTVTRSDSEGKLTGVRDDHHVFRALQKAFFFQHYGLYSSILDLTHDLEVALFFAGHRLVDGLYAPVDPRESRPVVYLFILDKRCDLFMDSGQICEHYGLFRPLRQRCGLLGGASFINRNDYARMISAKIYLAGELLQEPGLTAEHLFPTPEEDPFLKRMLEFAEREGLSRIRPQVPVSSKALFP